MPTPTATQPATKGTIETALAAEGLTVAYGKTAVVHGATLAVRDGSVTGLIGPNGSGKSSLLRALARLITPRAGTTTLHGEPIDRMPARQLAQQLAVMPQHPVAPPGVTVRELVAYGRAPFNAWYKPAPASDRELIDQLIERCDLAHLANRLVHTLSGGERQRAWIAMALAQQPRVLLLDEPVSALDIGHQLEVMDLLADVNREHGTTLVIVLHDLNLAGRYCDELVALHEGQIIANGPIADVLNPDTIRRCFNVEATFHPHLPGGPACTFKRTTTRIGQD